MFVMKIRKMIPKLKKIFLINYILNSDSEDPKLCQRYSVSK